jgi:hypothetical protein
VNVGYGTIAAANVQEVVLFGQVDADNVDLIYIKSIDNTMFVEPVYSTAQGFSQIRLNASEACVFNPSTSTGATVSVLVVSDTAGAKYEYIVVGQSS